jgi:hypothetical protein
LKLALSHPALLISVYPSGFSSQKRVGNGEQCDEDS